MIKASHRHCSPIDKKQIGLSEEGRPLSLYYVGQSNAPIRILIVAGQHGDEPLSTQAVEHFLETINVTKQTCVAVISCLNPDGASKKTRLNAFGVDLNRDHQRLQSSENRALHKLVREFCPQLIIDVHTYPPRRKHLLAQGLVYHHDVFVDVANTPAINPELKVLMHKSLMPEVIGTVQRQYTANRYTLINASGRVRHSSPDVSNARNMLALRYNTCTLLLEGREGKLACEQKQTIVALNIALKIAVNWSQQNANQLQNIRSSPHLSHQVVLQSCYLNSSRKYTMLFRDDKQQKIKEVVLPGKYSPDIKPTLAINLPQSYLIPKRLKKLLQTLEHHGFHIGQCKQTCARQYFIEHCKESKRAERSVRKLSLSCRKVSITTDSYAILRIIGDSGKVLALFLEPNSKYGLCRHDEFSLTLKQGQAYPILRIESRWCSQQLRINRLGKVV